MLTAQSCLNRAHQAIKVPDTPACLSCAGTGTINVTMEKWGERDSVVSTPLECWKCKGSGMVDRDTLYTQALGQAVWCTCDDSCGSIHAPDGNDVFGNDTYLCTGCGMVIQFG